MKKGLFLILSLLISINAFGWGQKGHDVIAYIAECNVSPSVLAKVEKVLDGHSPVYYANWMDDASNRPEYRYTKTWHYLNVDEGKTLETMPKNPKGDVLEAITSIVEKLKQGGLSHEEEAFNLKMLIHLVGDMHCPMHLGRLSDLGGNRRPVSFFGRNTSLHKVWDSQLPESAHKWSYTEWQQQIDRVTKVEKAAIQRGEVKDWILEVHAICTEIYEFTPEGSRLSYDYVSKYTPIVERQFLRGGLRLARLLNEIYK